MEFKDLGTLIKRFLGLPNHWYGDVVIKFQAGDIVNVKGNTSYDIDILNGMKLTDITNNNNKDDDKIRSKKSK